MWQDRKKGYTVIYIMRIILRRPLKDQKSDEETLNNSGEIYLKEIILLFTLVELFHLIFYTLQDQKTYKNETYENELKNSGSGEIFEIVFSFI
jgi:hypothetical protein